MSLGEPSENEFSGEQGKHILLRGVVKKPGYFIVRLTVGVDHPSTTRPYGQLFVIFYVFRCFWYKTLLSPF